MASRHCTAFLAHDCLPEGTVYYPLRRPPTRSLGLSPVPHEPGEAPTGARTPATCSTPGLRPNTYARCTASHAACCCTVMR
eukprot:351780-Chlamydomonas_euryale.AAC.2